MGIKVNGVNGLLNVLKAAYNDTPKKIKQARIVAAREILNDSKKKAPKLTGQLRNSGFVRNTETQSEITYNADYAPYLEFGTGGKVDIPAGYEELASQFKGKGIKQVNIKAQPYLIPAYLTGSIKFKDECQKIVKQAIS